MKFEPPKNRPKIILDQAQTLGERFFTERSARKISTQEMADHLILSTLQIVGLEKGDLKSFYSAKLFAQSADKYANFLGFDDKPSEYILTFDNNSHLATEIQKISVVTPSITDSTDDGQTNASIDSIKPNPARSRSPRLWVTFTILFAAGLVIALYTMVPMQSVTAAAPKAEPLPPTTVPTTLAPNTETATATPTPTQSQQSAPDKYEPQKTEAAVLEPSKTNAATKASTDTVAPGHLLIKFTEASWVQSVDQGGIKQEKIYKKGDTLDLEPNKLQALVIGNAGAVAVSNSKAEISLKPYIASGSQVARILGPDIRKLGD